MAWASEVADDAAAEFRAQGSQKSQEIKVKADRRRAPPTSISTASCSSAAGQAGSVQILSQRADQSNAVSSVTMSPPCIYGVIVAKKFLLLRVSDQGLFGFLQFKLKFLEPFLQEIARIGGRAVATF